MTNIEWTDETWNPTVGCSRVSAGCDNCYAMGVAHRGLRPEHAGLTKVRPKDAPRPGVDWTGEVRTLPARLQVPLSWRKPRRVFVDSMSDLFHHGVPFEFVAAVFGVMAATPKHTYQVLTKRPERAREFFAWVQKREAQGQSMFPDDSSDWRIAQLLSVSARKAGASVDNAGQSWPLPNVHLGTSVEDQASADARIPFLLGLPAAVRWVSYEPALGPVNFADVGLPGFPFDRYDALRGVYRKGIDANRLDWIVVGGESGSRARPFDLAWARKTVADCRAAGVPVFVKQLGARPFRFESGPALGELTRVEMDLADGKGGDMAEWPEDIRVREEAT